MPASNPTLWGIHMGMQHGRKPLDEGFITLGWTRMGDLSKIPAERDAFKGKLSLAYPQKKPGAVPVEAGVLYRFAYEMKPGDLIVYPSKADRMINIGEVTGPYTFNPGSSDDPSSELYETTNQRAVKWIVSVPRTSFSQGALKEIGAYMTLFQISTHAEEVMAALRGEGLEADEEDTEQVEAAAERVEEDTEDFVIRRLKTAISPDRFEHFVAHLLRCMGYHARVTPKSGDGGIDIIAHRDELGFEPPVIKVQCKQVVASIGRPDVQKLIGATDQNQYALFVTLGNYTREALDLERLKSNLRLIDGSALVDLVFQHYDRFEPIWQTLVPLKRRYLPSPVKSEG